MAAFLIIYRQRIMDQITVWQYTPTTEINSLVERSGMNDNGKFIFFASQPKLESTNNFNKECSKVENTTSILGCYNLSRIYIYNVTDSRLDGVREVTASHEMLHSAYTRLSHDEKIKLDKMLEAEYEKLKDNKDFSQLMSYYDRTEPGERDNELHSLIGTEISNMNPELETYYSKYFSDRQKIVALNAKYIGVFMVLKKSDDEITAKINDAYAAISKQKSDYSSAVSLLNSDIAQFNSQASSSYFSSQAQFNYQRSLLVTRSATLETMRQDINSGIANYDALIVEHNANATESQKLYNMIDSSLAPAPSV